MIPLIEDFVQFSPTFWRWYPCQEYTYEIDLEKNEVSWQRHETYKEIQIRKLNKLPEPGPRASEHRDTILAYVRTHVSPRVIGTVIISKAFYITLYQPWQEQFLKLLELYKYIIWVQGANPYTRFERPKDLSIESRRLVRRVLKLIKTIVRQEKRSTWFKQRPDLWRKYQALLALHGRYLDTARKAGKLAKIPRGGYYHIDKNKLVWTKSRPDTSIKSWYMGYYKQTPKLFQSFLRQAQRHGATLPDLEKIQAKYVNSLN